MRSAYRSTLSRFRRSIRSLRSFQLEITHDTTLGAIFPMTRVLSARLAIGLCCLLLVIAATGGIAAAQQGQSVNAQGSPDINVYTPDNEVTPGSAAEFTVQLDNDGKLTRGKEADRSFVTTARSVVVELDADDAPITVNTRERSYGTLTEDEPRDAVFNIDVPNDAEPGTYEVDVKISYEFTDRVRQIPGAVNDQNQRSRSVTETVEIEISDDARFRVDNINSTLRVGEEGEITGNITNVGGEDVTNAQIAFDPDSPNIFALETTVAVGDIAAGDSTAFSIPVEAGSEARAVDKQFDLAVSYRDANGIRGADDDPDFIATIGEKRNEFLIEPVDRTIQAGTSQQLDVEVTNNRDERVTDIEAKLFADDPLDSSDDEAYIESLEAGESTTVSFELNAESGATAKTYPVSIDFRYDDSNQRSQLSDSYRMAIDVTESEEGGLPLGIVAIGLVVLAGAGYALYRRE